MKRRKRSDVSVAGMSHPGETRTNNEDRFVTVYYDPPRGVRTPVTLVMVADGIGGHQAGEVASSIAAQIIPQTFDRAEMLDYRSLFTAAFEATSAAIAEHSDANPESQGLGTTCVAALVFDRALYTAAIGDSRIYFMRNGALRQISIDHSWVQEARDKGILSTEEARNHPRRNVLRRYLGAGADATPDFRLRLADDETDEQSVTNQGYPLQPGDRILLCSDGLSDLIDDDSIQSAMQAFANPQACAEELVRHAREAGGTDNVTAVILNVGTNRARWVRLLLWAIVGLLVLGGLGAAAIAAATLRLF